MCIIHIVDQPLRKNPFSESGLLWGLWKQGNCPKQSVDFLPFRVTVCVCVCVCVCIFLSMSLYFSWKAHNSRFALVSPHWCKVSRAACERVCSVPVVMHPHPAVPGWHLVDATPLGDYIMGAVLNLKQNCLSHSVNHKRISVIIWLFIMNEPLTHHPRSSLLLALLTHLCFRNQN